MPEDTQEGRTQRLSVACTRTEEHAAKTVAMVDHISEGVSGLLRVMSLEAIMVRYEEIQASKPPVRVSA